MSGNGGAIINISSIAGKRGSANAMYCATKFGMNGLTQSLAKELGPAGIRVNALCPVLIRTDGLMDALATEHSPAKGDPEGFLNNFLKANSATGSLPRGEDVGNMAVYLAADSNNDHRPVHQYRLWSLSAMTKQKVIAVIPAHMASVRFPGKILHPFFVTR